VELEPSLGFLAAGEEGGEGGGEEGGGGKERLREEEEGADMRAGMEVRVGRRNGEEEEGWKCTGILAGRKHDFAPKSHQIDPFSVVTSGPPPPPVSPQADWRWRGRKGVVWGGGGEDCYMFTQVSPSPPLCGPCPTHSAELSPLPPFTPSSLPTLHSLSPLFNPLPPSYQMCFDMSFFLPPDPDAALWTILRQLHDADPCTSPALLSAATSHLLSLPNDIRAHQLIQLLEIRREVKERGGAFEELAAANKKQAATNEELVAANKKLVETAETQAATIEKQASTIETQAATIGKLTE